MKTYTIIYRRAGSPRNLRLTVRALNDDHTLSQAPLDALQPRAYLGNV